MKAKVRKHKKSPALIMTKQVITSTITNLRNTFIGYGVPQKVVFDNYKPTKSKSS